MENPDRKTNGSDREYLRALRRRVREAINAAYKRLADESHRQHGTPHDEHSRAIRDYVENMGMIDRFEDLETREGQSERKHRGWGPEWAKYHRHVSVPHCALLIILNNIGDGARLEAEPSATTFVSMRTTAAEAELLGYLARVELLADAGLVEALQQLDYAAVVSR
jgi:hypothetical protein